MEDFDRKMERSGYGLEERKKVMRRGLMNFDKIVKLTEEGVRDLHRAGSSTEGARYKRKLMGKTNWYKGKKKGGEDLRSRNRLGMSSSQRRHEIYKEDPVAILFIERTPGGQLISKMRETEEEMMSLMKNRVKLVEKAGSKLEHIL